jgi:hypothetical protein
MCRSSIRLTRVLEVSATSTPPRGDISKTDKPFTIDDVIDADGDMSNIFDDSLELEDSPCVAINRDFLLF